MTYINACKFGRTEGRRQVDGVQVVDFEIGPSVPQALQEREQARADMHEKFAVDVVDSSAYVGLWDLRTGPTSERVGIIQHRPCGI
jgi:hypothetical protein